MRNGEEALSAEGQIHQVTHHDASVNVCESVVGVSIAFVGLEGSRGGGHRSTGMTLNPRLFRREKQLHSFVLT
jgi:hypothetical protein